MKVVWRYSLRKQQGIQGVVMPQGAEILSFGSKDNELNVWVLVTVGETVKVARELALVWTGNDFKARGRAEYVGTARTVEVTESGYGQGEVQETIVWHLFDLEDAARG